VSRPGDAPVCGPRRLRCVRILGMRLRPHKLHFCRAGELDFQADEAFLEAMVTFALSVPVADIWQDRAWARQQQRLLTAQFGPDEVAWVRTRVKFQYFFC